ncbi:hypothetical protein [Peptostreptococcus equinus]|uniref:DUF4825 domain-containing protein n=1 Tax=Peptostreptococcus equinus TaxID=3003601 RepID=A0ABY7JST0_9FIRM|nr:hypothetical protein [Peptostreptococcus sp. CBA3647]WAW14987.1 hypothetical protein O0R46_00585 [Peptostreptococcus sp. CBA3647]
MLKDKGIVNLILAIALIILVLAIGIYIKSDKLRNSNIKENTSDSNSSVIVDYNRWYSLDLKKEFKNILLAKRNTNITGPMAVEFYYKNDKYKNKIATIKSVQPKDWKFSGYRKIIGVLDKNGKERILFLEYNNEEMDKMSRSERNLVKRSILSTIKDDIKAIDGTTIQNEQEYDEKIQNELENIK